MSAGEESHTKTGTSPSSQEINQGVNVEGPNASQSPYFQFRASWSGSWHETHFCGDPKLPLNAFYEFWFLNTQPVTEEIADPMPESSSSLTRDLLPSV